MRREIEQERRRWQIAAKCPQHQSLGQRMLGTIELLLAPLRIGPVEIVAAVRSERSRVVKPRRRTVEERVLAELEAAQLPEPPLSFGKRLLGNLLVHAQACLDVLVEVLQDRSPSGIQPAGNLRFEF